MVKLNRITTKTGDDGTTGLGDGRRVSKHSPRMVAIGEVDEANAAIGLACLAAKGKTKAMLVAIQNDLFDLGAELCLPHSRTGLRISSTQVTRLEGEIAVINAKLKPLSSFVLPGGTALAAQLHLARAIVRRAERALVALAERETVSPPALAYINRLSDHLFVLSRAANRGRDLLWQPGKNR